MKEILLVGFGGFAGSILRYAAGLMSFGTPKLNFSTLSVNLVGSLIIGLLSAYLLKNNNQNYQLLLVTGFCGGFTTYSTFSLQLLKFMEVGNHLNMILYLLISLVGGVGLCYLGLILGSKFFN
ncbi:MAG: fluoride efflux transporter CrcB [Cyclobacteriaceae bacterium]